jgi:hypothetical protein
MTSDVFGVFITYLTAGVGPISAIILVWMMIWDRKFSIAPWWHRYGLAFFAVGMVGQSVRSWVALVTGISPRDSEMPWWVFKDIGIFVLAVSWLALAIISANKKKGQNNDSN